MAGRAIFSPLIRYTKWLHTKWPAGLVEKLPEVNEDGTTAVPGVYVVGDLSGVPLLKFSAHTGARAVKAIVMDARFKKGAAGADGVDVAIIGAGVSGIAAAMEAKRLGLSYRVLESSQVFSTVVNFPKAKPIFTYPTEMTPEGQLQFQATVKEGLLEEMERQRAAAGIEVTTAHVERVEKKGDALIIHHGGTTTRAGRVVIAIGRSGNFRKIGCPGEDLAKVYNRLHDPKEFVSKHALVVGGGDSALEAACALAEGGARVTLSYRKKEFARPKPDNVERLRKLEAAGRIKLAMETTVREIRASEAVLSSGAIENDVVFPMIGREAPLDFFRRSGIPIRGEWNFKTAASFAAFFAFCTLVYLWKAGTGLNAYFKEHHLFPFNMTAPGHFGITLQEPGFYYSLAYTLAVVIFGVRRIKRRRTPYVRLQTATLMASQVLPLFILPYFVLPEMGARGLFDAGFGKMAADALFPVVNYGYGREYWRAFGFVLAWPLFIWNMFTEQPMWTWLAISLVQTFVVIPLMVKRWGKGAYCGWLCSCGALAETLGDTHRQKMPHGPKWNRLNMIGQVVLAFAFVLLAARVATWIWPNLYNVKDFYYKALSGFDWHGVALNYYHIVDIFLAGIVGVGLYFHFSGRVWCRFACPLAALMHIYARFTSFRIFAKKEKCISCNVCTSVCHQGIDVMSFANKGKAMEDPECVRCSACVQSCPTGVLSFGRIGQDGLPKLDRLVASAVQMAEARDALVKLPPASKGANRAAQG